MDYETYFAKELMMISVMHHL